MSKKIYKITKKSKNGLLKNTKVTLEKLLQPTI